MTAPAVAAIYLLREDGAALLQHRDDKAEISHPNMWVPPGGHCEDGEGIEACARREFFEETDYRLGELRQIAQFVDDHAEGFPPLRLTVFWGAYDGVQSVVCREGQALEFVPRGRAEALGMPQYLIDLWDVALRDAAAAAGGRG